MTQILRHIVLAASGLAILATSPAVLAQSQSPARTYEPSRVSPGTFRGGTLQFDEAEKLTRYLNQRPRTAADYYSQSAQVADCLARRRDTAALIGGPRTSDRKFDKLVRALKFKDQTCLRGTFGAVPMMIAGALAAHRIEDVNVQWADRARAVDRDRAKTFISSYDSQSAPLDMVGRCVAVYSPGLARRALQSTPGGPEEQGAFDALYEATPECGLKRAPVAIPLAYQRVSIANGLFRWLEKMKFDT